MTIRRFVVWSRQILLACGALALLASGCATTKAKPGGPGAGKLADEDWTPGARADSSSDLPSIITRKSAEREVTEDQKGKFDKIVLDYQRAKKGGTLSPQDCSGIASAFKALADKVPALLEARSNEATVYLECGRRDEAVRIWQQMSGGAKPYARALANLGYLDWQGGRKANAEAMFNRAIQADSSVGSIPARINLAQMYRDRARTASGNQKRDLNDRAVKELRRVLALDGNSLQAYAGLCFIYFDLDLPEAAKLVGAQAIKRAQEIATGEFEDLAAMPEDSGKKAKKGKGKKDESQDEVAKSGPKAVEGTGYTVEMKQALAVVHNTLGMIALSKKNYTEAIKEFSRAVDNDPTLYESRLNLAALSLKFRNYEIAERNLRAVLAAQPKNYEAIIGLGVALRGQKKFDEAEAEYNRARTMDSRRPESYFNLGLLYQEYKGGSDKPLLQRAQGYYRDFLSRSNVPKARKDAEKRIKDIDEVFAALEEAAKMMKEAEEMQRKAEAQQKKMEEEMKRMEAEEKRQAEEAKKAEEAEKTRKIEGADKAKTGAAGPAPGAAPAPGPAGAAAVTPPPAAAGAGADDELGDAPQKPAEKKK